MRHGRRITAMAVLAALALPGAAGAEDAFIRIEAKRGAAAQAAVEGWRTRFPDVVTVPLANGMTGIVLGPQPPAEAAARMARLKAEGAIPADSYLTGPGGEAPLPGLAEALSAAGEGGQDADGSAAQPGDSGTAPGADAGDATKGNAAAQEDAPAATSLVGEAAGASTAIPAEDRPTVGESTPAEGGPAAVTGETAASGDALDAGESGQAAAGGETAAGSETAPRAANAAEAGAAPAAAAGLVGAMPDASPSTPSASEGEAEGTAQAPAARSETAPRHIQLQATPGRASAEAALAEWRRSFPAAQLWRIPGGWYAVALPARLANEAEDLLGTLKSARRIPGDAFLATPAELGRLVEPQPGTAEAAAQAPDTTIPAPVAAARDPAATGPTPARPALGAAPAPTGTAAEPAPPAPAVMPPIEEVQRLLRWAGRYDGPLDGKSGPGTRAAIEAQIEATGGTATPAEAMAALIAEREDWRRTMGLEPLNDKATGLTLLAPRSKLAFDRTERALSIYGPKDGSGAAMILFSQPGGQQEMEDLAGLVTALGWVPHPRRDIGRGRFTLTGANDLHIGHAEGRVQDGLAEGWVLIWPAADAENARRLAIEAGESFTRTGSARSAEGTAPRP